MQTARTVNKAAMGVLAVVFVALLGLLAWYALGSNFSPAEAPAPAQVNARIITQAAMGDAWPFTVPEGTLRCVDGDSVVFVAGGTTYAVNGTAKEKYDAIDPIWRENPAIEGTKIDLAPLVEEGLAMCP